MLVLSRKMDESIFIITPAGEKIEVKIVRIETSKVRIGFEAPKDFEIVRKELLAKNG